VSRIYEFRSEDGVIAPEKLQLNDAELQRAQLQEQSANDPAPEPETLTGHSSSRENRGYRDMVAILEKIWREVTRRRESSAAFIRFAKLFPRALRFFHLHFFCNLNVEPAQLSQFAGFLFGGLATLPLQNDAARTVAAQKWNRSFQFLFFS
jgi:hypothetical protein